MSAQILPFTRSASEAWAYYLCLQQETQADPRLVTDRDHLERRLAAHRLFFALFSREAA